MRSYDASSEWDQEELARLNAEPWQLELLALNPSYTFWGPHEDYMWTGNDAGWRVPIIAPDWSSAPIILDDMNEVVNFYFAVNRESAECSTCGGNGYHPDAQEVVNSYYAHMNPAGEQWHDKITQDEVDALWEAGRLRPEFKERPTTAEVNARERGPGFGHDAINRGILTEARLKRLGLPKICPECEGHGYVFTAPAAHVSLVFWLIHPRKGASRGVEVERIERADLPAVFAFLRAAAQRNAERFDKIPPTDPAQAEAAA